MKKRELKRLIEEHLLLRKRMENLREELEKLENRYDENLQLLYQFRSKEFLLSLFLYLKDLKRAYGEDKHLDDLVDSVKHSLKDYKDIEQRKIYTPKALLNLYDEKLE
jgi:uncharacterized protein YihD (DUF1040 family)